MGGVLFFDTFHNRFRQRWEIQDVDRFAQEREDVTRNLRFMIDRGPFSLDVSFNLGYSVVRMAQ